MDMQSISQFITGIGFPAFVAVFLLIQEHKQMQELTTVLNNISLEIRGLEDEFKHHEVKENES